MPRVLVLCLTALLCHSSLLQAAPPVLPAGFKAINDVDYAGTGNRKQMLNLYVPETAPAQPLPLIVYIHGGGWEGGDRSQAEPLSAFMGSGVVAGASIGYRLTDEAPWPAQIHDCKAALRWIAAHGAEHGIDTSRVALYGISAGGHLVSLLGTSVGEASLEGTLGQTDAPILRPRCVVNFCGPANFMTFEGQGSVFSGEKPGAIMKLFNGKLSERQAEAKAASPELFVSNDDPPFLHIHGTKDPLVPYVQAVDFDKALGRVGVSSTLLTGEEGNHVFFSTELHGRMNAFLARHLLGQDVPVPEDPVAISDAPPALKAKTE